jgi:hypothetical protein
MPDNDPPSAALPPVAPQAPAKPLPRPPEPPTAADPALTNVFERGRAPREHKRLP